MLLKYRLKITLLHWEEKVDSQADVDIYKHVRGESIGYNSGYKEIWGIMLYLVMNWL